MSSHMKGCIYCLQCGSGFYAHVSTRYCTSECKRKYKKLHDKKKARENRETKKARRNKFRKENLANGLCKHCKNPIFSDGRCKSHAKKAAATDRVYKAKRDYGHLWEKQVLLLTMRDLTEGIQYESQNRSTILIGE